MDKANLNTQFLTAGNYSAEDGLSGEMGQDIGLKGGEVEHRQDADDIAGPIPVKDWLWPNRQKEG